MEKSNVIIYKSNDGIINNQTINTKSLQVKIVSSFLYAKKEGCKLGEENNAMEEIKQILSFL